jgi:hypothetical protein
VRDQSHIIGRGHWKRSLEEVIGRGHWKRSLEEKLDHRRQAGVVSGVHSGDMRRKYGRRRNSHQYTSCVKLVVAFLNDALQVDILKSRPTCIPFH